MVQPVENHRLSRLAHVVRNPRSSSRGSSSTGSHEESPKNDTSSRHSDNGGDSPSHSHDTQRPINTAQRRVVVPGRARRVENADGTSLRRSLGERHVNMIAFSSVVGIGLFLQNGKVINLAGPGMGWVAYPLMGSVIWSALAALGEMTALFPIPGAIFQMPCRFLDLSIGYAVGWMSWFSWVVVIAAELDAIAGLFKFEFDPDYLQQLNYPKETLRWSTAGVNPAVWVAIFLLFVLAVNLLRVRWYGEIEYWIGVLKMLFIVGVIFFNVIINVQTGTHFRFYEDPWGFISRSFISDQGVTTTGALGHLAGVWSGLTLVIFSMIGFESVSITAAENRKFETQEGIKISTRKIALRIVLLYTLLTFLVGLNVPYDDSMLADRHVVSLNSGTHSAFILAAIRARKVAWPGFFNGFFILSATSAALNSLYLSSRLLHAMALSAEAWPSMPVIQSFRQRLTETGSRGVPRNAIFASWAFGFLGFLAAGNSPEKQLGRLAINSTVSMLIVYAVICVTFIRFKAIINHAAEGGYQVEGYVDPGVNSQAYSRRKGVATYPYRSHGQPLRSYYALFGCTVMIFFNGWRSISPFGAGDFFASYISVFVFIILCLVYRCALHWGIVFRPELHPTMTLSDPVMLDTDDLDHGRAHLRFEEGQSLKDRERTIRKWIWVWLK